MSKNNLNGEAPSACAEETLLIEQFINEYYLLRRNVLSGKVEFAIKSEDGQFGDFHSLTKSSMNSIVIHAKRIGLLEKKSPKQGIQEYLESDEIPEFNPIEDFLNQLPKWDGHNHVADLFARIPGLSTEQTDLLCVWFRAMMAQCLQMNTLHGNETVPTLIGDQGCGKTTFLRRLLPLQLREYYLDHLNLSNKFDKEMALTNNVLVNIDEIDSIPHSQQPLLKQLLSKNKVNGRPIFGAVQKDRPRYASFAATTNNRHPLTDATGSRRHICIEIPSGQMIDNSGVINYEQLYAQAIYELKVLKAPYWFNNDQVKRIQELNLDYMAKKDLTEMIAVCFRKPNDGEIAKSLSSTQMLGMIQKEYPTMKISHSAAVQLGLAMRQMGFEHIDKHKIAYYQVIPLRAA